MRGTLIFTFILIITVLPGTAQKNTIPGEITSPYPTLRNLAVEWAIGGDDNQNCKVTVQFRERGEKIWHEAMPLFRVPAGKNIGFSWPNKLSGSIFDLKPDSEYEIWLKLTDPDGGSAERKIESRTRPVPVAGAGAEFIQIKPGIYDTLKTQNGTREKPVVYKCNGGEAVYTYIDLNKRKWVYIEGLTIENHNKEGIGIQLNGAENCVVRNCKINSVWGIVAYIPGAVNCYISDNVVTGTCPPAPEREVPDLRPKAGSLIIDGGIFIPNINDDFKGTAPDCGAYEYGQELPHYGPR